MPSVDADVAGEVTLGLMDFVRVRETAEEVGENWFTQPPVDVVDAFVDEGGGYD